MTEWRARGLVALFVLCLGGCPRSPARLELFDGVTMGTTFHVKVVRHSEREPPNEEIAKGIDAILARIDAQMSTWRQDSELARFNAARRTDWFPVSAELVTVIGEAQRISALSEGAFDVTVAPLLELWGFGPKARAQAVPTEEEIAAEKGRVGYRHLHLRRSPSALRKDRPDLQVELSAIAPGYAVDRIAAYLDTSGFRDYLVELGGEVRVRGRRPDGRPWRIAIEKPSGETRVVQETVVLTDHALSTSGDYRDYFVVDGRRYSHTIDPRTGRPVAHRLASVSVVADTAMTADALSTALMVLGPERGYELARREGWAALFVERSGGKFDSKSTKEFQGLLAGAPGTVW